MASKKTSAAKPKAPRAPRKVEFSPRTDKQKELVQAIKNQDVIFATGPAGCGKTYVVVSKAVEALLNHEVETIIVSRPIVEAGENLGFLPGDIREKTDPYNAPILDALKKHLGYEMMERFILEGKIQLIPLAFTRGRTYDDAWMILDEAQNTTPSQMLMFLTRMGRNSKITITGDESQIDLPKGVPSGLMDAVSKLHRTEGAAHIHFSEGDVQRHYMVGRIVGAYNRANKKKGSDTAPALGKLPKEKLVKDDDYEPESEYGY